MGYLPDFWGSWNFVLTLGRERMELQSINNHPRFALQAEGGGEVGWWEFPVLASNSQGFLTLQAAHRAPHPTSEKLVLTGRGQVTNLVPTLGPLPTRASPVPFPEFGLSILIPSCQVVPDIWAFS